MQIEAGKFYRTRDGRKVGPMVINERGIATVDDDFNGQNYTCVYANTGLANSATTNPSTMDIVDGPIDDPFISTGNPIRTITRKEIVPGRYGAVHVIGLVDVPDCDDPNTLPVTEVRIGIDASMTPDELDAAASVLTQIAAVLRENQ